MEPLVLERKSRVLAPSRLPCLNGLPTLRLASGCMHGCLDCYAEGACGRNGAESVVVTGGVVAKLREELLHRRHQPAAVCLDFSSDPFQPVPELLDATYDALEFLLGEGIGVIFQTKAKIPVRHMKLLLDHAPLVRAIVGLVTTDRRVLHIFEPHAATPRTRLRQMRQLVAGGVSTLARVDPILPGVTDDPDTMHGLCAALAEAGVRELAAGVLVLRPAVLAALRNRLARPRIFERLVQPYLEVGNSTILAGRYPPVLVLPAARRRRIFQWLKTIAARYSIEAHVCACKNADLANSTCRLVGQWAPAEVIERQLGLFT